ncbi:YicC/YloC family endoribonuclease [Pseudotabrizicola algicola]|uniref:YicC family protein n=1 Tax=Pseudotabrizicola algicola TaxID=2709381 RepID=A0A6B3RIA7_9RHOB|nr:YicC/YloC family endoribonuclease [Pseudotabrizicola algicola]NEX45151.1 YicC family protein [Pseudotabrizicola algicola]
MTVSMTGFAARKGQGAGYVWAWDIRSVNGKGLDLRLRLPDWIDGLELAVRAELQKALSRGNVSLSLKVSREQGGEAEAALLVKVPVLDAVLAALQRVEDAAMKAGVTLAQATAADVLAMRGVLETGAADEDTSALRAALLADLPALLADFAAMRAAEGAAMQGVIAAQLDQIAALTAAAQAEAEARRDTAAATLREALARVLDHAEGVDAGRLAQELALLAVKQDVTEELDRLGAHVAAARALLAEAGPVGRKFDFLMQEFMREANTLCSKAQALALTRIGLDLKTVIDQMREQVQNVE